MANTTLPLQFYISFYFCLSLMIDYLFAFFLLSIYMNKALILHKMFTFLGAATVSNYLKDCSNVVVNYWEII